VTVAARITVIGAGTMGHGIAYAAALVGCAVTLTDSDAAALELAWSKIDGLLAGGMKRGKLTDADAAKIRGRLRTEPDAAAAVAEADVVVEAGCWRRWSVKRPRAHCSRPTRRRSRSPTSRAHYRIRAAASACTSSIPCTP